MIGLWHSDTYTKQLALVREIEALPFPEKDFVNWFEGAFFILNRNWDTIDYYRTNKF
jgi:hypothetical protein